MQPCGYLLFVYPVQIDDVGDPQQHAGQGQKGHIVRCVVKTVSGKINDPGDHTFGPKMEQGLVKMQKANGLGADGILGSASWNFLLKK